MCVIIASPEGKLPTDEVMERSMHDNPHGWGLMYFDGETLNVSKGMKYEAIKPLLKAVEGKAYALHLRWATHGPKVEDNCHPFRVSDGLYMMHNGVIDSVEISNPVRSDSFHFALKLRDMGLTKDNINQQPIYNAIADMIGYGNKLVFMDSSGDTHIINEDMGMWDNGIWHSNTISLNELNHWMEEARWAKLQYARLESEYALYRLLKGGE